MGMQIVCLRTLLLILFSSALGVLVIQTKWAKAFHFFELQHPTMVYKQRNFIVELICKQKNLTNVTFPLNRKVAAQLYVEHSHKFIYCEVPKAGCSNWKRIILSLNDSLGLTLNELRYHIIHASPYMHKLSSYASDKQEEFLANYTKVMFTRDPLERVVAAYRDKFLHGNDGYYGKNVQSIIRKKLGIKPNATRHITFKEFVRFVVVEDPRYRDTHWKPMYQLCDPCSVHYNIIGKLETVNQDAEFVLKTIGAPQNLKYPNFKYPPDESRTNDVISSRYLDSLPPNLLRQLLQVYSTDFSMFGYDDHYNIPQFEASRLK
ncbi:carbohydrate sulfotransferase 9-like isoform X1 [Hyperolius riggenbachi]|uniref:carbohydrate sulfotransferase 9-like isoform X1 n=1 Tax=Hyperolius riggenbachi TaxID=752182 RepID=UPI0035A32B39